MHIILYLKWRLQCYKHPWYTDVCAPQYPSLPVSPWSPPKPPGLVFGSCSWASAAGISSDWRLDVGIIKAIKTTRHKTTHKVNKRWHGCNREQKINTFPTGMTDSTVSVTVNWECIHVILYMLAVLQCILVKSSIFIIQVLTIQVTATWLRG